MTAFEEFGVMPELGAAVDEMGWTLPTDVQVGCSLLNSLEIGSILEKWGFLLKNRLLAQAIEFDLIGGLLNDL